MASVLNAPHFQDEAAAYAKIESLVWPNGAVCPHCQSTDRMKLMLGNATRPGLYKCYACRKQSRVTVGTVFESSHIKLHVWLQAAYLMCSSKKGISSNQLALVLGLTVKSAWFMSRRLRGAMTAGTLPPKGGEGETVEIDETFIGNKEGEPVHRGFAHKQAVLTLVKRGGKGDAVLQSARQRRAAHQRRQERNHLDPAVLPPLRRERGASATARPGLQPRQLPAHPDLAGGGQPLVDDHLAGQAGQDRREDRSARAIDHVPDGRGDSIARVVSGDPRRHRDAASFAGGTMLRDGNMTGWAGHRRERCVLVSAEIAGFASKWRTQRR
jgi:transposase-like protein